MRSPLCFDACGFWVQPRRQTLRAVRLAFDKQGANPLPAGTVAMAVVAMILRGPSATLLRSGIHDSPRLTDGKALGTRGGRSCDQQGPRLPKNGPDGGTSCRRSHLRELNRGGRLERGTIHPDKHGEAHRRNRRVLPGCRHLHAASKVQYDVAVRPSSTQGCVGSQCGP